MIEVNASEIISVDKNSGTGPSFVTLTASANPLPEERMAKFSVKKGDEEIEVMVTQEAGEQVVAIPEFDYLVLRYGWDSQDGKDFDTATGFVNTGLPDVDGKFVGWSKGYSTTSMRIGEFLRHGGDNMKSGLESALINMKDLLEEPSLDPDEPNIEADIYGNWYEELGRGNVVISFTAYLGGTMSLKNFNFINEGGEEVYYGEQTVNVNVTGRDNYQNIKQLYKKIGRMIYNKEKRDCVIFL